MEAADLRELFFLNERGSYETDSVNPQTVRLLALHLAGFRKVARAPERRAYFLTDTGKALVAALVGYANALTLPLIRSHDDG